MGNPRFVTIPEWQWYKIASGVKHIIFDRKTTTCYYWKIWRIAGTDAPPAIIDNTIPDDAVKIFELSSEETIVSDISVDIYILCQNNDNDNDDTGEIVINLESANPPQTSLDIGKSAFGDLSVSQFNPQTGWTFNYNLNPAIVTKTELFGGTVTQEGSFAKCETGTAPNGVAFVRANRPVVYAPGIGALVRFTAIFDTPQENSQQLQGVINAEDGWAFGYDGLKFGVLKRRGGIDEWTYQEDWSEDVKTTLNPQKGNVYQIKYQWLGFGMQYFGIENDNGDVANVHRIKYTNLNDDVSVENASLPLAAGVGNSGNTTNITLKTPSMVGGLEGVPFSPVFEALVAYERIFAIPAAGEHYLFGLQNPEEWLGKDNRLYIHPRLFTAATDLNKAAIFRVYSDPTITTPVWVDVEPDISPLQYDESGTFVLNGEAKVFTLPMARVDTQTIDLRAIDAEMQSRQVFAVTVESTSTTGDVVVGINFKSRT